MNLRNGDSPGPPCAMGPKLHPNGGFRSPDPIQLSKAYCFRRDDGSTSGWNITDNWGSLIQQNTSPSPGMTEW